MKRLSRDSLRRPRNVVVTLRRRRDRASSACSSPSAAGSLPDVPTAEVTHGRVRRHARDPRRDPAAEVDRARRRRCSRASCRSSSSRRAARSSSPATSSCEFDGSTLQRTMQEKQSELKQADAEIEQTRAQARITDEQNATALMKAQYDLQRAKLDVTQGDTVSRIEHEQAKLAVGDAEQKLKELAGEDQVRQGRRPRRTCRASGASARRRCSTCERAQQRAAEPRAEGAGRRHGQRAAELRARAACSAAAQEFREGDRAWAGASILELPDLSSVHLEARLDESDRGRLNPGQDAIVKIEAVPGREFKARIDQHLASRARRFQLRLAAAEELRSRSRPARSRSADPDRHDGGRAHRDRARARRRARAVGVGVPERRLAGRLQAGRLRCSASSGSRSPRRGKEQAIVTSGVEPGDRIATRRPSAELIRRPQ